MSYPISEPSNMTTYHYVTKDICSITEDIAESRTGTSLDLSGWKITHYHTIPFGKALALNTNLLSLNLSNNNLMEEHIIAVRTLFRALSTNTTLKYLYLQNCNLSDAMPFISTAMKVNGSLELLDLSRNTFHLPYIENFGDALKINTALSTLILRNASLDMPAAAALFESLSSNATLTKLDLSENSLEGPGVDRIAAVIASNTTLKELHFEKSPIMIDDGAKLITGALKCNSTLTTLNLADNKMKPKGGKYLLEALSVNTTITSLNIVRNYPGSLWTDSFMGYLSENPPLKSLVLSGGVEHCVQNFVDALWVNTTLTSLTIGMNHLEDSHVPCLAPLFSTNTTLTSLDLVGNNFTTLGAVQIRDHLKYNPSLTILSLESPLAQYLMAPDLSPVKESIQDILDRNVHNNWERSITLFSLLLTDLQDTLKTNF